MSASANGPRRVRYGRLPPGWDKVAKRVLIRDAYICALCGKGGADSADHIVPRARGGTHDMANLQAAHSWCNSRKGAHHMDGKPRPSRYG